jgi:hypothetical protein
MSTQPEEIEEGEIVSETEVSDVDEELEDLEEETDIVGLMTSLMATEDGDTVCSALVEISNQMRIQNKILIKILSNMGGKN